MTIEERAARAVELKAGCNCAQAVVLSYADKLPLEEETLRKLAAGYGGGMGCMEGTCGALVGAVMVAGMLTDGQGTGRMRGRSFWASARDAAQRSART